MRSPARHLVFHPRSGARGLPVVPWPSPCPVGHYRVAGIVIEPTRSITMWIASSTSGELCRKKQHYFFHCLESEHSPTKLRQNTGLGTQCSCRPT